MAPLSLTLSRGRGNQVLRDGWRRYLFNRELLVRTVVVCLAMLPAARSAADTQILPYTVINDGIPVALTEQPGDATRGRDIAANRQVGMCPLCHQLPANSDRFQGDIATSLTGAGTRWTVSQLRLRIVDARRLSADSVMPAYYKLNGLTRVGTNWRDRPILNAQQVEDVVAWLASLK